jgi:hypothetical protein
MCDMSLAVATGIPNYSSRRIANDFGSGDMGDFSSHRKAFEG